jgi:hypothetical protein
MNCDNFVIWNPVPADSTLKAKTRGTNDNYTARIRVVSNHDASVFWNRGELDPGPASHPISEGDQISVFPRIVAVGQDAATVTMDIWVEQNGARVRECTWTITPEMSPFLPVIVIIQGEEQA